ncbi:MAG: sialidase family protein [Anaerolineae bacterium]
MNQQPLYEKTALFQVKPAGEYATYRIPGIVVTAQGSVLAYCEARKSASGDWGAIDILLHRSTDGGKSWSVPVKMNPDGLYVPRNAVTLEQHIALAEERTFNNPVAIADRQPGIVHFILCAEYARCFYLRSTDDGLSWSQPVDITAAFEELRIKYNWRVIATGPGHGIQLQKDSHTGRLLIPVWMSTGTGGHGHRPSAVSTIYSDDSGRTWHGGEIVVTHGAVFTNPSETAAIELADGRIMLNIRSEAICNRRLVTTSADGATGWTTPIIDKALYEPICFASIQRLSQRPPQTKNRILFSNPDSKAVQGPLQLWGKRENLTVRMSYDEGVSWPVSKTVDPGLAGYSDLATTDDGAIFCAYEGGGLDGNYFSNTHLSVAKFNLAWLTDGVDSVF